MSFPFTRFRRFPLFFLDPSQDSKVYRVIADLGRGGFEDTMLITSKSLRRGGLHLESPGPWVEPLHRYPGSRVPGIRTCPRLSLIRSPNDTYLRDVSCNRILIR